jgi:hypothetical protein
VQIGKKVGYISKSGRMVIEPQFVSGFDFSEGLADVLTFDGWHGYVDKTGRMVIKPQFELGQPFQGGLALVVDDGKIGYINKSGSFVWTPSK